MNKTKKNKKGGDSDQKGKFIPYENIDNKAICPICQDPLKLENEEQIIEKGIVYQLSCGHQFHNNCLKGWCKTIITNANKGLSEDERIFRVPENFKCPICGQKTLKEEEDCTSVNELYPIVGKFSKEYGSEKYTGLKPKTIFDRFFKGGKTKKNKQKKNKTKKLYTYKLSDKIEDGHLKVSNLHSIYYSCYGNKNGIPLLVIHGGPGGMLTKKNTQKYNPKKYFIILADQRGCGKSTPFGELRENNTDELVKDFEKLRKHLHIKKWILCGGSWGSTLALVYAIKHPSVVRKMFISGIFLGNNSEVKNVQGNKSTLKGAREFFPRAHEEYETFIPRKERSNILKAYMRRFQGRLGKTIKNKAHMKWATWETTINSVTKKSNKAMKRKLKLNNLYKTMSMIECHYFLHDCFLPKNYILKNTYKIKHIPTYIVQGHFDLVCFPVNAYMLHKALPKSKLFFTNGGHALIDKENAKTQYEVMKKYG